MASKPEDRLRPTRTMYDSRTGKRVGAKKSTPARAGVGTTERQKAAAAKNKRLARSSGASLLSMLKKRGKKKRPGPTKRRK